MSSCTFFNREFGPRGSAGEESNQEEVLPIKEDIDEEKLNASPSNESTKESIIKAQESSDQKDQNDRATGTVVRCTSETQAGKRNVIWSE